MADTLPLIRKTVLVLGAGASAAFGFPTGETLLKQICELKAEIAFRNRTVLTELGHSEDEIRNFCEELSRSPFSSVDAFLGARTEFMDIGKNAIAASLIPYENPDTLRNRTVRNWYRYFFFDRLGLTPETIAVCPLQIVTFNYDRSLTFYLFDSLRAFGIPTARAIQIVERIQPIHVHGQLGALSGFPSNGMAIRNYAPEGGQYEVRAAAQSIKVLSESTGQTEEFGRARAAILEAELVVFLGFGYHSVNVERLRVPPTSDRIICGSVYNVPDGELDEIKMRFDDQVYLGERTWDALDFLAESPFVAWARGANLPIDRLAPL